MLPQEQLLPFSADMHNLKYGHGERGPLESQKKFHASAAKFKGFSGSVGSGKSFALAYEAIYLSWINKNCVGYVLAPTYTMLQDAAQQAVFNALQCEGIEYDFQGSSNRQVLTFKPGDPNFDSTGGERTPSQIYFRTANNPDRLRGVNLAWFGLDEMTYSDEEAWKILLGRIRDPRARTHTAYGCWTPKGYDWVWKSMIDQPAASTEVIFATPRENIHLPGDYYDSLKSQYDENWYMQEVEGQYLDLYQGQVYYNYHPRDTTADVNYMPGVALNWSLDFNVNPFCSVICQYVEGPTLGLTQGSIQKPWGEIWVIDEVVLKGATFNTYQMCEAFRKRTEPWLQKSRQRLKLNIYGDATGTQAHTSANGSDWRIIRDFFAQHSSNYQVEWFVPKANPPIRHRVNAVNAALLSANGIRRLRINPRCKMLLDDLMAVKWREGDQGVNMDPGPHRELTHISDALGYYIVNVSDFTERMTYLRSRIEGI